MQKNFIFFTTLFSYFLVHVVLAQSGDMDEKPICRITEEVAEVGIMQTIALDQGKALFWKKSKHQEVAVYKSKYFGKVLVIDGAVQLTEKDADSYNEMMAHIPLMEHANPRKILIVGGGDGFILNEVLKHSSVERVDHVDLDEVVIEACMEHLSMTPWKDDRVNLHIADGAKFLNDAPAGFYDVIIQDSSDPDYVDENGNTILLPASVLFSTEHFSNAFRALKKDGIFSLEAGSWNFPSDVEGIVEWRMKALKQGFQWVRYGNIITGSYPMGHIGFLMCKKKENSVVSNQNLVERFDEINKSGSPTTYYHPSLQRSCFDVPWILENIFYNSNPKNEKEIQSCEAKN